jgi:16S rRNA (cytidine1402-2'-O)-methyltransferase
MLMTNKKTGTLYIVATPIGNLQDITLRAIETLKKVDRIAAEDTRHSTSLLEHFSIKKPTISLHNFNECERAGKIITSLLAGESFALITDAGTPLISDPGFYLVRETQKNGIPIVPIPGPCAAIAALSISGLAADRFSFEGFLPAKEGARQQILLTLKEETRTLIFYEAPHRILSTLETMRVIWGDEKNVFIARELTKVYESCYLGSLATVIAQMKLSADMQRGEIVLIVEGAQEVVQEKVLISTDTVLDILLKSLPLTQAVKIAVEITGERKNVLYEKAIKKHSSKN